MISTSVVHYHLVVNLYYLTSSIITWDPPLIPGCQSISPGCQPVFNTWVSTCTTWISIYTTWGSTCIIILCRILSHHLWTTWNLQVFWKSCTLGYPSECRIKSQSYLFKAGLLYHPEEKTFKISETNILQISGSEWYSVMEVRFIYS